MRALFYGVLAGVLFASAFGLVPFFGSIWLENINNYGWQKIAVLPARIERIDEVAVVPVEGGHSFVITARVLDGSVRALRPDTPGYFFRDRSNLAGYPWFVKETGCDTVKRMSTPTELVGGCFYGNTGGGENSLTVQVYQDTARDVWLRSSYSSNQFMIPALGMSLLSPWLGFLVGLHALPPLAACAIRNIIHRYVVLRVLT
jgi:hypothetical protein